MNELTARSESEYQRWCSHIKENDEYSRELKALSDMPEERLDSFYRELTFGTSGIRGLLGPGTNRINSYVVRRATQGLADYMKEEWGESSCVIAYDSRRGSSFYAHEAACILNGNGIRTWLFDELTPVSVLSYAIRALGCQMGIMITASHNPKIYNGYKVYSQDGYQVVGDAPRRIFAAIREHDYFESFPYSEEGILSVNKSISDGFVHGVSDLSTGLDPEILNRIHGIYTPLNGTGLKYMESVFREIGYENYKLVESQSVPDEEFPTCPQPNPEKLMAFEEAFRLLDREKADLIIATDPDADRIGVALYHNGIKTLLSGSQLGLILLDYLCQVRPPRPGQIFAKSIATSPLAERIADAYSLKTVNCLSGFKYIGEMLTKLRKEGRESDFYMACEESNGYLLGSFLTEKDGIQGGMMALEAAAYHKSQGKDLMDRLEEIYAEYGALKDQSRSYIYRGPKGQVIMEEIMAELRAEERTHLGNRKVDRIIDYMGETGLPKGNVMQYDLSDGSRVLIRPSGTEPKIKVYYFENGDFQDVEKELAEIIDKSGDL